MSACEYCNSVKVNEKCPYCEAEDEKYGISGSCSYCNSVKVNGKCPYCEGEEI